MREEKMSATPQKQANTTPNLDQLCINTIRTLTIDAVQKAESGHAGLPLGLRAAGLCALDPLPQAQPAEPEVGQPRPLPALRRPRLDAALLAPLSHGLRPRA